MTNTIVCELRESTHPDQSLSWWQRTYGYRADSDNSGQTWLLHSLIRDFASNCVYSVVSIFKDAFLYFFELVEVFSLIIVYTRYTTWTRYTRKDIDSEAEGPTKPLSTFKILRRKGLKCPWLVMICTFCSNGKESNTICICLIKLFIHESHLYKSTK